jgi:hypothetical protein
MAKGHPKLHSKPTKAHPGFKAEQKKMESKGMSKKESGAILGNNYRKQLAKKGK